VKRKKRAHGLSDHRRAAPTSRITEKKEGKGGAQLPFFSLRGTQHPMASITFKRGREKEKKPQFLHNPSFSARGRGKREGKTAPPPSLRDIGEPWADNTDYCEKEGEEEAASTDCPRRKGEEEARTSGKIEGAADRSNAPCRRGGGEGRGQVSQAPRGRHSPRSRGRESLPPFLPLDRGAFERRCVPPYAGREKRRESVHDPQGRSDGSN